jgi:iron complex outermembrane receptor protein
MAAICASPPADAQAPARIGGSTQDPTGAPISGMTMTLKGAAERVTLSGPDGRFAFENLPAGEYELRGVAAGFAPIVRRLRLAEGENVNVELRPWVLVLDSVTVTAPRTGERDVQATPLAVTVLSGTELQRAQSPSVEDVSGRAPAVRFTDVVGLGTLTIRGIGTNAVFAGSDPSSAVYVDGVYLARPVMALADLFDTERIEVLRGPQGTLYGRNAVGGALHVITKDPTSELDASARLVAGDGGMLRADARVSGRLVPGRVMGSAAFLRGLREGFVRDLDHPGDPLGGEDVAAARVKLLVVLARRSELLLSGDMTHRDPPPLNAAKVLSVKPGYEVDNPQPLHEVRTSTLAESRNRQYGAAARLTLRLSPGTTLTSLTAFRKVDFDLLVDSDITELRLAETRIHEIQHQWSEEVTASGGAPRLRWVGGVFVLEDVDREPFLIRLEAPGLETRFDPAVDATSGAAFVQATLAIARHLSLTAGLRYTRERKTIDNFGSLDTLDVPPVVVPGSGFAYSDSISHGAWTPKLALELRRGERWLGYASATRGFKSGGFNFTSREPGHGYDPEWAWSYEAGLKARAAGGRARLSFAAFHTDYTDLQVQTIVRGVPNVSNAAAATIRGFEAEGTVELSAALQAGGYGAWLDATYDRYLAVPPDGVPRPVAGHRLNNVPAWSGRLWFEWKRSAGRARTFSLRADSRWQSTVFFTPFNDAVERQSPYGLLDASLEIASRHWSSGPYARNLTNEGYITATSSFPPPAIGGRPGEPRQVGVQLTLRR